MLILSSWIPLTLFIISVTVLSVEEPKSDSSNIHASNSNVLSCFFLLLFLSIFKYSVLTKQIPLNLRNSDYKFPEEIEIRGEIYIEKDDFHSFNKKYQKEGKKTFANPRNFAAGSIRQLDPNIANSRPLKIFCHSVGYVNPDNLFDSHMNLS